MSEPQLLDLLYTDEEAERVFRPGPTASFRSARRSRSYLVWDTMHLLQMRVGSFKCVGKYFQVCFNVTETETFSTASTYKINHECNYNESSLIYLLTCKICRKQYIGQMVDIFCIR